MSDTFDHEADALDMLLFGEDDGPKYYKQQKTCNRCGESGLYWLKTPEGWRLSKKGIVHRCSLTPTYDYLV